MMAICQFQVQILPIYREQLWYSTHTSKKAALLPAVIEAFPDVFHACFLRTFDAKRLAILSSHG